MPFFDKSLHDEKVELDHFDIHILNLLQQNNKLTIQEIAKQVSLSVPPCQRRIARLKETGVIQSNVVLVNPEKIGRFINILLHLNLIQHTKDNIQDLTQDIAERHEVLQMYVISGSSDIMLNLCVRDMEHYNSFLHEVISKKSYISAFTSHFCLGISKNSTFLDIASLLKK